MTAISTLNSRMNANKYGQVVDLTPYNTSDNRYTFPTDGYLLISGEALTSGLIRVPVYDANEYGLIAALYMNITEYYQIDSLYVKKGMKCYVLDRSSGTAVRFYSIAE